MFVLQSNLSICGITEYYVIHECVITFGIAEYYVSHECVTTFGIAEYYVSLRHIHFPTAALTRIWEQTDYKNIMFIVILPRIYP